MNLKKKREKWAKEIWGEALNLWSLRSTDINYRKVISRPLIYEELSRIKKSGSFGIESRIVDFGCGEGIETINIAEKLDSSGFNGKLIAYEPNCDSAEVAKKRNKKFNNFKIEFETGDFKNFFKKNENSFDMLFSLYVLNEASDVKEYLSQANKLLKTGGGGIFQLVDPKFVNSMVNKKVARINKDLSNENCSVIKYPILEGSEVFYLPVFNRSYEQYLNLFEKAGFDIKNVQRAIPDKKFLEYELEILPFCRTEENIYYPEIVEMPSTLHLEVVKK